MKGILSYLVSSYVHDQYLFGFGIQSSDGREVTVADLHRLVKLEQMRAVIFFNSV